MPTFAACLYLATFIFGTWWGSWLTFARLPLFTYPVPYLLLILIGSRPLARLSHPRARYLAILTTALITLWLGTVHTRAWRHHRFIAVAEGSATLTGTIIAAPDVRSTATYLTVQPDTPLGSSYSRSPPRGAVLIRAPVVPAYHYQERVQFQGTIRRPQAFNGFNYPLFLEKQGIYATLTARQLSLVAPAQHLTLLGALYSLRGATQAHISAYIPEPAASFLGGILLGSKQAIPADVQAELKTTGTTHMVAISGANITIMLTLLVALFPIARLSSRLGLTIGIALFMTLLTGASASVIRGSSIACLSEYLRYRGRARSATPLLLVSATAMLIANPLLIRADPGFQLSFAAYAGLLYLGKPLEHWLKKVPLVKRLPLVIQQSFTETTAATCGTAGISWYLFHTFSLLGLLVNPLILWLLPLITFLGLSLVTVGWWAWLSLLIAPPLTFLLQLVLGVIHTSAHLF